jgi:general secretion pathway protein D
MVVQDGQTVVIGGLIKESSSGGRSGVPVLSRIPVVGALFGFQRKTVNRSELMLLLTPHVIANVEEADLITREFQDKLSIIQKKTIWERIPIQDERRGSESRTPDVSKPEIKQPEAAAPDTAKPTAQ